MKSTYFSVILFSILCLFSLSSCNSGNANVNGDTTKAEITKEDGKKGKKGKKGKRGKKGKNDGGVAEGGVKVGDIAPDFSLKGVDGKMVSLADYKDAKGFIVTFTCNHCPYAVMYEDRLVALNDKMAPMGYPVIAINPNDPAAQSEDSFDLMAVRAKEKGFTFPYLFDDGQKIYPQYGATKTPHVFLLDNTRKVRYIGAIDDSARDAEAVSKKYVEDAIEAIEAGKEPTPDFTKAIGCSIKSV